MGLEPGIYADLPEEDYFADDAVGRSDLWCIHDRSPYHLKYGSRAETNVMRFGKGFHLALLQPELFETTAICGPADRRGNKWKDAQAEADKFGKILLIEGDYDKALWMRDAVHRDPFMQNFVKDAMVEHSAFVVDTEYGVPIKARVDAYSRRLSLLVDVKSTENANPKVWNRRIEEHGLHLQPPHYTKAWTTAGGGPVGGFAFLVIETKEPFVHEFYELAPRAVMRGAEIRHDAMRRYIECTKTGIWPKYSNGQPITLIDLPHWAYPRPDAGMVDDSAF